MNLEVTRKSGSELHGKDVSAAETETMKECEKKSSELEVTGQKRTEKSKVYIKSEKMSCLQNG